MCMYIEAMGDAECATTRQKCFISLACHILQTREYRDAPVPFVSGETRLIKSVL